MKPSVLLIHGWTQKGFGVWAETITLLEKQGIGVIALDLPGFGESDVPDEIWGAQEYAVFIRNLLITLQIEPFLILGHSFGGSIAMILSGLVHFPHKLCLCAPAIVRPPLTIKQHLIQQVSAIGGRLLKVPVFSTLSPKLRILWRKAIGSRDYAEVKGKMSEIFQKVVREDLTAYLIPLKKKEVTIIWGTKDTYTPYKFVKTISAIVPQAVIVSIPGIRHNLPLYSASTIVETIIGSIINYV